MTAHQQITKQLRYKAWANTVSFDALSQISVEELEKKRQTTFGSILFTLNHIYVVDDIFKSHLTGESHGYTFRNTESCPTIDVIQALQSQMDQWYLDYAGQLKQETLDQLVSFQYVGGGDGAMTVYDILQHLVNHGTYHHGFVSDMMYQIPVIPPANDYTVFIRDVYSA